MDLAELEQQGLMPRNRWSRRGFVMTSLATGFALSAGPVSAETIGINGIFFYRRVDSGEIIAQIAVAKIFYVGAGELFALAVASARIRQEHVITAD